MMRLFLVTSGETNWDRDARFTGNTDIPLNENGIRQSEEIVRSLSGIDFDGVYSGTLSRNSVTAQSIAASHKLKRRELPELGEINLGIWQGLLEKEIKKRYKRIFSLWMTSPTSVSPPKGESIRAVYERAVTAIQKLAYRHSGQTICVVSSLIVNGVLRGHYLQMNIEKIWQCLPKLGTWEIIEVES